MLLNSLLTEEQSGVLHFGGARMALMDIEAGFWGLRQQMEALVGRQLTDTALQQAGANGGAAFARAFITHAVEKTAVSLFEQCVAAYQAAGFGQFDVEILEWPIGRVRVIGHHTIESWMMKRHQRLDKAAACVYTAGVLVGFINMTTDRRDIVCVQTSCEAHGADRCTFELIPATEANQTAVVAFDPNPGLTPHSDPSSFPKQDNDQTPELSALLAITQNVASALELEPMLQLILEQFKAVVDYDGAAVLDLDGNILNILAYRGPVSQADARRLCFPLAQSKANQAVIQTREPAIISDVRADTPLAKAFQATAGAELETTFGYIRSWMGIPLISRDQVIGMLSLDHHHPNYYTGRHSLLALTFASKVAVAIENSRLYQAEQNRRRELQTLLDVAAAANSSLDLDEVLTKTLDRLVDLIRASRAGVLLLNPQTKQLEPRLIRPARSISAENMATMVHACQSIVEKGSSLYIPPDPAEGFMEPGAFLPLHIRDKTLGLIVIIGAEKEQFSQEQLSLFQSIADQLAVAVENAYLYEQAEQVAIVAERNRLARDLHDAVTQTLFSASLIADVLPRIWERDREQGQRRLEELRELTRGALAEMRTLLLELRPATLTESSLGDLLRQLTQAFSGRARLPVELIVEGERPLPPDVQVAFYRIAQEALNNVVKHAGASQATLNLLFSPQHTQLSIYDNGRGFNQSDVPPTSIGLGIMRERAEKIGAKLTIQSQIGAGTVVTVMMPTTIGSEEYDEGS